MGIIKAGAPYPACEVWEPRPANGDGQDRADALGWGRHPNRPKTIACNPTIPQKVTNVSIYDKGPEPSRLESSDPSVQRPVRRVRRDATGIAEPALFHGDGAPWCCARAPGKLCSHHRGLHAFDVHWNPIRKYKEDRSPVEPQPDRASTAGPIGRLWPPTQHQNNGR